MTNPEAFDDLRLIEAGFPCRQVGAETQRERGASSALPPLYFLHVWWARRPLTPSRAAILASLLPADSDPDKFLRDLGIERVQVDVNGVWWTISGPKLKRLETDDDGREWYRVDHWTLKWLEKENDIRREVQELLEAPEDQSWAIGEDGFFAYWMNELTQIPEPFPGQDDILPVRRVPARPAEFAALMEIAKVAGERVPNLYGYNRAYRAKPPKSGESLVVLDPTAGGGSIPFEAMRLGHRAIANELNPVACLILMATVDYPARYGQNLISSIQKYGRVLLDALTESVSEVFNVKQKLSDAELVKLDRHLSGHPALIPNFDVEEVTTFLHARQVTCPHCGGDAPLLNSCWLAKKGDQWGMEVIPDGKPRGGTVSFETYRVMSGNGPAGQDPDFATVTDAVGLCIHCRQAISADEIKRQARGESKHGKWSDRLYGVVAVRYQPKLDKDGQPELYKSGDKKGQIKTQKIKFFRPPNDQDLKALELAEEKLTERWPVWERAGLIPTERIPEGEKTREPLRVGITRWCDMFTPRQLLGHLTLVEELIRLKPRILEELGKEKGKAVVTYLQFAIDKGVDYNSRQTRWEYTRGIVKGTFGRHDFSTKLDVRRNDLYRATFRSCCGA